MNSKAFTSIILLCTVTVAVFAGSFGGGFHYDDSLTVLENPHLDRWETFVGHLDHMVRPVLYGTFMLDRFLHGNNPAGYHLLNLFLHLGSGILLHRILTRAVAKETSAIAFWTSLLFLTHPIQTETVTYISGRASGLMAFFYLLAFWLYLKASEQGDAGHRRRFYLVNAVLSFLLAIGSKETAVTFPLILFLWDVIIRGLRGGSLRTAILTRHLPFLLVPMLAAIWARSHPRYTELAQFSFNIRPFWDNLLSELHAASYSMTLFFTPWNQNFDHDLPEFHSLFQWPLPLDLLLFGGLVATASAAVRRLPLLSFGIGWFFVQLLPTSLIPRNDVFSERNLYLASAGFLLATVMLGMSLVQRLVAALPHPRFVKFGAYSVAAVLVLALCLFTDQRNRLYRDGVLLWSDAVSKSPNKARPHNNLGHAYALRGDWERAIDEFRTAVRLDPDFIVAQQNLRDAYLHHVGRR